MEVVHGVHASSFGCTSSASSRVSQSRLLSSIVVLWVVSLLKASGSGPWGFSLIFVYIFEFNNYSFYPDLLFGLLMLEFVFNNA